MFMRIALAALFLLDEGCGGNGAAGRKWIGVSCSSAAISQSIRPARAIRRVNWPTFSSNDPRSSTRKTEGARTEMSSVKIFLYFNDMATTEIYTVSLPD